MNLCHAELLFLSFMSLAPRNLKRSFLERVLTFLGLGVGLEAQVLVNITCTTPSMPRLGETPYLPMQAGPKSLRGV